MTTDTDDEGFTTVHQSAAFAGAGSGGVVRPDLPVTLSAAQAEILALRGRVARLIRASEGCYEGPCFQMPNAEPCICRRRISEALTNGGDNG